MMGIVVIPLSIKGSWITEKFSNLPENKVSFTSSGMSVQVKNSASPLFYPFDSTKKISKFEIEGEFKDLPKFKDLNLQGKKGHDDYPLRVGLIIEGDKKLTGLKKAFAPEWIKKIYGTMKEDRGIDHIQFYNVTQNLSQLKITRTHFASELLQESFFAHVTKAGKFNYAVTLDKPENVAGLWISIDGDDTKAEYEVEINKLTFTTQ